MSDKLKGTLSIIFMAVIFFLEIETKYLPALGDYVLDYLGIISLSDARNGVHLGVVYFGVLFIVSIFLVERYAVARLDMKWKTVLAIFMILVTSFTFIADTSAQYIKRTSEGLLAIAYDSKESVLECDLKDQEIESFDATFTLHNLSKKKKEFFVSIDHPVFREDNTSKIEIHNHDGTHAIFSLQAGEVREFHITSEAYKISGGIRSGVGYYKTNVSDLVLSNGKGEVVKLSNDNYFGTLLHD